MVIAGLVLSILAFLLGWVPILGWILVATATIITLIGFKETLRKGMSITSVVLVVLTWLYKIFLAVFLVGFFSSWADMDVNVTHTGTAPEPTAEADVPTVEIGESELVVHFSEDSEPSNGTEAGGSVYGVNEQVPYETLVYTVTAVEALDGITTDFFEATPSEGNVFLAVSYQTENVGKDPVSKFSLAPVALADGEGSRYEADLEASGFYATNTIPDAASPLELASGNVVLNTRVFEIPRSHFDGKTWFLLIDETKVQLK